MNQNIKEELNKILREYPDMVANTEDALADWTEEYNTLLDELTTYIEKVREEAITEFVETLADGKSFEFVDEGSRLGVAIPYFSLENIKDRLTLFLQSLKETKETK